MAVCSVKVSNSRRCSSMLYRCDKCGSVGCTRDGCTKQNWRYATCMSCGSSAGRKPI